MVSFMSFAYFIIAVVVMAKGLTLIQSLPVDLYVKIMLSLVMVAWGLGWLGVLIGSIFLSIVDEDFRKKIKTR